METIILFIKTTTKSVCVSIEWAGTLIFAIGRMNVRVR